MIENKKLKERILDLAITGKLTKLDRDFYEKSDFLFSIPVGWEWKKLQDIASVNGGYSFQSKNYRDNGIRVFRISDFNEDGIVSDNIVRHDYNDSLNSFVLNVGDTVICMTGGTVGKSLYIDFLSEPMVTNQRVATIKPKSDVNSKYIGYVIKSKYVKRLFNENKTSTNDNISLKLINELPIPFPPLAEQNEIVNKIDELFELVNKKEQNDQEKAKLKVLLREKILDNAIMGTLIKNESNLDSVKVPEVKNTVPFEIPSNWIWAYLKDISDYGNNKKKSGKDITDNEWILELEDIEKDTGKIIKKVFQKERKAVSDKNIFKENDVLYGKLRPYLNKCVIVHESGYCSTEIEPITLIDYVLPKYLHIVLTSKYFLNYVNSCSYGAKMPRLGTKDGQNAMIPVPPLEEQKRIVKKIESLFELIEQL